MAKLTCETVMARATLGCALRGHGPSRPHVRTTAYEGKQNSNFSRLYPPCCRAAIGFFPGAPAAAPATGIALLRDGIPGELLSTAYVLSSQSTACSLPPRLRCSCFQSLGGKRGTAGLARQVLQQGRWPVRNCRAGGRSRKPGEQRLRSLARREHQWDCLFRTGRLIQLHLTSSFADQRQRWSFCVPAAEKSNGYPVRLV